MVVAVVQDSSATIQLPSANIDSYRLTFDRLSLQNILEKGDALLSSAGKEYDADYAGMDVKERIQLQKKDLRKRLGIGSEFMDGNYLI